MPAAGRAAAKPIAKASAAKPAVKAPTAKPAPAQAVEKSAPNLKSKKPSKSEKMENTEQTQPVVPAEMPPAESSEKAKKSRPASKAEKPKKSPAAPKPPKLTEAERKSQAILTEWRNAMAETAEDDYKPYIVNGVFNEDDLVSHAAFGKGKVVRITGIGKMEVLFADGVRRLIFNRRT
jgi:hypothetical protein